MKVKKKDKILKGQGKRVTESCAKLLLDWNMSALANETTHVCPRGVYKPEVSGSDPQR